MLPSGTTPSCSSACRRLGRRRSRSTRRTTRRCGPRCVEFVLAGLYARSRSADDAARGHRVRREPPSAHRNRTHETPPRKPRRDHPHLPASTTRTRFPMPDRRGRTSRFAAFEHMLRTAHARLTEEELADAIELDPSQIRGLGPEPRLAHPPCSRSASARSSRPTRPTRRERGGERYRANGRQRRSRRGSCARRSRPGAARASATWSGCGTASSATIRASRQDLLHLRERWARSTRSRSSRRSTRSPGERPMTVDEASRSRRARDDRPAARAAPRGDEERADRRSIDMDELSASPRRPTSRSSGACSEQIEEHVKNWPRSRASSRPPRGTNWGPRRTGSSRARLLEEIFSDLEAARSGRHSGPIVGEGAVELPRTRPYEFGDSMAHIDVTQTMINAYARRNDGGNCPRSRGGASGRQLTTSRCTTRATIPSAPPASSWT
jgi:hypothetical protein